MFTKNNIVREDMMVFGFSWHTEETMEGIWQGQGIKKLFSSWRLLEYDNNLIKRK